MPDPNTNPLHSVDSSHDPEGRASFLLNASAVLSSTLDYQATLSSVAQLAVSQFSDCCIVFTVEKDETLKAVSVAHKYPTTEQPLEELLKRFAIAVNHQLGPIHVIRTGEPQLIPVVSEKLCADANNNEEQLRLLRELRLNSILVVPLYGRHHIRGCLVFLTTQESGRYLGTSDLPLANDLARRASLAIDNARLFSERSETEAALRELTRDMEAILYASPLPVVHMDLRGRVLRWNPATERMTGWKKDEVIGKLNPMFPRGEDGGNDDLLERLRNGEQIEGLVVRRQKRDGSMIHLSKWASPLRNAQGKVQGIVAIYMDVTDRVRFLQVAAHELGNPLSSIKALVTLIKLYVQKDGPKEKISENILRLESETDRFTALLDEMITAFRTHQGTLGFQPTLMDINEIVATTVDNFTQSDHVVTLDIEEEPVLIWGDPRRLQQVVSNLFGNATKYSPKGSEIRVCTRRQVGRVLLSIKDSGIGIPEAELPLVFDEFYRATTVTDSDSADETRSGIGLGLYICREIVLQHKGRIWVESEEGVGSTFYVELPLSNDTQSS